MLLVLVRRPDFENHWPSWFHDPEAGLLHQQVSLSTKGGIKSTHSQRKAIPLWEALQSLCLSRSKLPSSPWPRVPATPKARGGCGKTPGFLMKRSLWPQIFYLERRRAITSLGIWNREQMCEGLSDMGQAGFALADVNTQGPADLTMMNDAGFHLHSIKACRVETSGTEPRPSGPSCQGICRTGRHSRSWQAARRREGGKEASKWAWRPQDLGWCRDEGKGMDRGRGGSGGKQWKDFLLS